MSPPENHVRVHSVAEAYLYLLTLRCPHCARGPVQASGELTKTGDDTSSWAIGARCGACEHLGSIRFTINPTPTREAARSDCINPTNEPSLAIDLLGWLTLFQSIINASEKEPDRSASRQLAHEAAQCLDEAMKFYGEEGELPSVDAFFGDEARRRFREHPEHFARAKWRQRRLMLPEASVKTTREGRRGKRWWQFWRGGQ
ncbi:MAG: hypothetical protein AABZ08_12350 [Planctomycetota bacterium]